MNLWIDLFTKNMNSTLRKSTNDKQLVSIHNKGRERMYFEFDTFSNLLTIAYSKNIQF